MPDHLPALCDRIAGDEGHREAGPLRDVALWVDHYRQFWEQSFDRLDDYLKELQKEQKHGRKQRKRRRKH